MSRKRSEGVARDLPLLGQCSCKLHHVLGKTCTACLFGVCVLLSHFLPVSLSLSGTKISAAHLLSCACAGMLLLFWWFLQTLSYLLCSKAFCPLGSALSRMPDDKCLCHQMRFHTEILGGILHIIMYLPFFLEQFWRGLICEVQCFLLTAGVFICVH